MKINSISNHYIITIIHLKCILNAWLWVVSFYQFQRVDYSSSFVKITFAWLFAVTVISSGTFPFVLSFCWDSDKFFSIIKTLYYYYYTSEVYSKWLIMEISFYQFQRLDHSSSFIKINFGWLFAVTVIPPGAFLFIRSLCWNSDKFFSIVHSTLHSW